MNDKFLLKDKLFNKAKVTYLATLIKNIQPTFDDKNFIKDILIKFPILELKARIFCISEQLKKYLPNDFRLALSIILQALPKELDRSKTDNDFGDFILVALSVFVAKNGLQDKYLNLSFNALAEMTKRFSVEDSIRYFINQYPNQSFAFMQKMANSNHYHQRRLASEGLRPKLPWCIAIDFDYKKSITILDNLYDDDTRFVLRSVANHLNDIAKIDANLVVQTLQKWQQEGRQKNKKEMQFLKKHALRTLIKKGNQDALKLLGFNAKPNISIANFKLKNSHINLGEYLQFDFDIHASSDEKLMIDYLIIYPTKNARISQKVFKIRQIIVKTNHLINLQKKHLFKLMSTKKLYTGTHKIHLQINGQIFAKSEFKLMT